LAETAVSGFAADLGCWLVEAIVQPRADETAVF